ncbi:forkhead associated domain-containing protein [Cryptosporidium ubiquitum]|uniref:Forkhead associated domain-containing protein n=1 Tax=Cryptosporidium ubiquitum TaxID=857276 RepID=A0A1J4MPT5_9CRYT|nr:forkhead associated domain-containing protein [Cryptosporidium ubiquitum]OII75459.1 forkhead associated domain-containing protein [Cryptosporidium ubiquitum]
MKGFNLQEEEEFYSDSIECSEFEDSVEMKRSQDIQSEKSKEDDEIEQEDDEYEILNSHKRFRKIESSQESYTQNSSFNYLNSEIEDINNRIKSINSSIENTIMNSGNFTNPVCILEHIHTNSKNSKKKILVQVGNSGIKIGRNPDCDFPGKTTPNKNLLKLSRNHAYIFVKKNSQGKDQICLVDCNSVNGTYVNNVKIKNKILNSNDILSFGYKDEDNLNFEDRLSKNNPEINKTSSSENYWKFKVILCNN